MTEQGRIDFDTDAHPLVVVSFRGTYTTSQFEAYLEKMDALLADPVPYVLVLDASTSWVPSAAQRRLQAEWIQRNRGRIEGRSLGTAMVIRSQLVRGALTAILWMTPLPSEHVVFTDLGDALTWARARLNASPPPDRRR